jgi:hypothetical protein
MREVERHTLLAQVIAGVKFKDGLQEVSPPDASYATFDDNSFNLSFSPTFRLGFRVALYCAEPF